MSIISDSNVRKSTFGYARPVKIQISLRECAVSCQVSSCGQRRLKSGCADAQPDLSHRWTHMSEGTFSHVASHILSWHIVQEYFIEIPFKANMYYIRSQKYVQKYVQ